MALERTGTQSLDLTALRRQWTFSPDDPPSTNHAAQSLSNRKTTARSQSETTRLLRNPSKRDDSVPKSPSEKSSRLTSPKISSMRTIAESQPLVVYEEESITTNTHEVISACGDQVQRSNPKRSFCAICINLNKLLEVALSPAHRLRSAVAEFMKSSLGGCRGCAVVARVLLENSYATAGVEDRLKSRGVPTYNGVRFLLGQFYTSVHKLRGEAVAPFEIFGYPDGTLSLWGSQISGDTGSDSAVIWAHEELKKCMRTHSACAQTGGKHLPTRVLRIDGPGDVKLHVTADEVSQYVCLSHCWGKLPIITTTSSNLERFQQQIPWRDLPKTFQDAISFSLRLGFRYLWIDSLCIVQDSAADWRHEGSKMASIYRNASLTLAATSSSDSNGGLFVRTPTRYQFRKWSFTDAGKNTYEIRSRSSLDHDKFISWELPLSSRAWAFQERLLAPRVLHFTNTELIWECLEQINCECSVIRMGWSPKNKTTLNPNLWADESLFDVDRQWRDVVFLYKAKNLTFDRDIFPALQGLAQMVPNKMGPYLAGLWGNTLASNLSWYVSGNLSEARLVAWRAPSWSWASNAKPIRWANMQRIRRTHAPLHRSSYITVLDAKVSAIGDDTTGEITSGEILIRGRYLSGKLQAPDPPNSSDLASLELQSADGSIVDVADKIESRDNSLFDYNSWANIFWDYDITAAGLNHVPFGTMILAMRIEKFANVSETQESSVWLLLKECSCAPDAFERIGLLQVHDSSNLDAEMSTSILDQVLKSSPLMDIKIV